jgi:hypothetical protein
MADYPATMPGLPHGDRRVHAVALQTSAPARSGFQASGAVVGVELLDAQQQRGRGKAKRGGEASQAAIAGVQAPGLDRGESVSVMRAATASAARPRRRCSRSSRIARPRTRRSCSSEVGPGKKKLPNWLKTTVCGPVFPIAALFPATRMREAAVPDAAPENIDASRSGLATLGAAIEVVMARSPNMTQTAVADAADLDVNQVNSYVCGRVAPTYPNFRRLARGLGVKAWELMAEIEAIEAAEIDEAGREPAPEGVASGVR